MKKVIVFVALIATFLPVYSQSNSAWRSLTNEELKVFQERKERSINKLVTAAISIVDSTIIYDPSYVRIPYPMGDVPANTGVCTDLVIRAFRKGLDWDLQECVYEYRKWQQQTDPNIKIDTNIDHRRVRNLMEYFDAHCDASYSDTDWDGSSGRDLTKCEKGDIIVFNLGYGILHIAICISSTHMVHNVGAGQVIDPIYTDSPIIRNYRLWDYRTVVLK